LISRPIHAPSHELEDTDTNTPPTKVVSKRILVELLGIREETVILYLWGMNPLAHLAYFSLLKFVDYILMYGAGRLLMLDGDSLILLDVMKVVLYYIFYLITIVLESGSSFSPVCDLWWMNMCTVTGAILIV
jgi:hypothetical protein